MTLRRKLKSKRKLKELKLSDVSNVADVADDLAPNNAVSSDALLSVEPQLILCQFPIPILTSTLPRNSLCFGLSMAPQVFTRVMAPVSSVMHRCVFQILRYLNEWLILGSSFREIVRARDFLLWLCQELSILVNHKSSLTPSQAIDYLGMHLQASPLRVFPTLKRVQKVSSLMTDFISCLCHPLVIGGVFLG